MNLNSTVRLTSDGTVRRVDLTYDVQETDIVQVYFDDNEILTGWTLQRNTTPQRVNFTTAIPAGTLVLIRRYTDMREIPHVFHFTGNARGGAEFNAKNLDDNFDKIKRAAQDAMDSFELIGINLEAAADAKSSAEAAAASAALANTHANTASNQAQLATTKAQEAKAEAVIASAASAAATSAKDHVAGNAQAALGYELQAKQHRDDAEVFKNEARSSQTTAAGAASAAQASANTAGVHANTASSQATSAAQSASLAGTKAGEAVVASNESKTQADRSTQGANSSAAYRDSAKLWAEGAVDIPVEPNAYSAKHWAAKAAESVSGVGKVISEDTSEIALSGDGTGQSKLKATITGVGWAKVTGKPDVFPTNWASVSGTPSTYPTTWSGVTGKPTTYPPIVGVTATTAKAGNWTPTWDDVSDKPTEFNSSWSKVSGKPTSFKPSTHSHTADEIEGLVGGSLSLPTPATFNGIKLADTVGASLSDELYSSLVKQQLTSLTNAKGRYVHPTIVHMAPPNITAHPNRLTHTVKQGDHWLIPMSRFYATTALGGSRSPFEPVLGAGLGMGCTKFRVIGDAPVHALITSTMTVAVRSHETQDVTEAFKRKAVDFCLLNSSEEGVFNPHKSSSSVLLKTPAFCVGLSPYVVPAGSQTFRPTIGLFSNLNLSVQRGYTFYPDIDYSFALYSATTTDGMDVSDMRFQFIGGGITIQTTYSGNYNGSY